jgi:hypothetical protein
MQAQQASMQQIGDGQFLEDKVIIGGKMFRQRPKDVWKIFVVIAGFLFCFLAPVPAEQPPELEWPAVTREARPWTYWWWHGSAVDKKGLTEQLEAYCKAGMGGVHIIPIYGVNGEEPRFIDYLSPKWMEMLSYTTEQAKRLGMGVDMSTGTGWPPGGPDVSVEDATANVIFRKYEIDGGGTLDKPVAADDSKRLLAEHLQSLMAYHDGAAVIDSTESVDANGKLNWVAPAGRWKLYAVFQVLGGKKVERAAPGGAGYIIDPFSTVSLKNYLVRFDKAFADYRGPLPRAQYHDSYEYGGATWTDGLLEQFQRRRGYDLRNYLPAMMDEGDDETVSRVKADYRETMAELHLGYIEYWTKWSHSKGFLTRNEAHGSPSNLLDTYAASDIPETEIFGPSGFEIPGLRRDTDFNFHAALNDPLALKFASSAAHVAGRKLASSESCTWLGEHFKVSLSQVKPEIDQLLVSGINHVFYHGMAYSRFDEPWPGRLFYASTNFAPSNSFWRDFPELNSYIGRCQSILQSGEAANDVLLYWPIHDLWHNKGGMLMGLSVHGIGGWLHGGGFYNAAKIMWERGYTFDYVSDRLLAGTSSAPGRVQTAGGSYRAVLVPKCRFMPVGTMEKLLSLARNGATVIFEQDLPRDVPGLGRLENRRSALSKLVASVTSILSGEGGEREGKIGKGRVIVGDNIEQMLKAGGVSREPMVDTPGVRFIRRTHPHGYNYFVANLGKETVDGWVSLGTEAASAVILEPLSGSSGIAALRREQGGASEVYMQLEPGQSVILRTSTSRKIDGPKHSYLEKSGEGVEIKGHWQVTFVEGGPNLPGGFETDALASWTQLGDDQARRFAGTARYRITFEKPAAGDNDEWMLDLGRVCESARVRVNGQDAGTVWSIPFKIAVGRFLRAGQNELEVEVTNLSANRIADMDRRKVNWKRFYEINFVNINYQKFDASGWPPMDSGLLGPVRLIPYEVIKDTKNKKADSGPVMRHVVVYSEPGKFCGYRDDEYLKFRILHLHKSTYSLTG